MKALKHRLQLSNKQNIHPNIMLPSTQQHSTQMHKNYPKVSCFKTTNDDLYIKDWRKRILSISDREKNLNNKLNKMITGTASPIKTDKLPTQAASHTQCSQKLGNTLRRYLYEYSMPSMTLQNNLSQLVEQLHRTTEEITGHELPIQNISNPEQVLSSVLSALKQFKDIYIPKQKSKNLQLAHQEIQN